MTRFFLFVFALSLLCIGCSKSVTLRRLRGDWAVSQFNINGVNQVGFPFTQVNLSFAKASKGEGDYLLTGTYEDGSLYESRGVYSYVLADRLEWRPENDFGAESLRFEMSLSPDELFLETDGLNGDFVRIIATAVE